jgi:ribosome maturation protein SDO1
MVSLDDAVLARFEWGGERFEILVNPASVDSWRKDHESVQLDELLATDSVWSDARNGDRPTKSSLENAFGTTELRACVEKILEKGSIQLTTAQRKQIIEENKRKIVNEIAQTATDPKTKMPHPRTRIENALDEIRFSVDPFKSIEGQVEDAVAALRPHIPLQFITVRLAFKIKGSDYGAANQILRDLIQKDEWLSDGSWACVVEVPGGMKNDLISKVADRSSDLEVREIE